MIKVEEISPEEILKLEKKGVSSYLSIILLNLIFFGLFTWVFKAPIEVFYGCSILMLLVFLGVYVFGGQKSISKDLKEGVKITRIGKVIAVNQTIAYKTRLKTIEITLEEESVPENFPKINKFDIYNSYGQLFYHQDYKLKKNYEELIGKQIELSYFPYSGVLLSFKLIS
ncbi:hypothetical protein [Pedobacter nototheniae]|uniref:hypothetical protein n=1 Tax=Pedobacter nototheniae TaxID=2488994 RepID=UPI00103C65CA|nr:hypothetical protein [Pedobacter nototheniae]